ncbi:hypothetical protein Bca4012_026747 [Brassica carinata]
MSTLVKKDEIALAQDSFVLQGYVDAIQLVMIAAVPALKEEVVLNVPVVIVDSESESESPRASSSPPQGQPVAMAKYVLIPGHAKEMDVKCQVPFRSILNDPDEEWAFGKDFAWDDETYDEAVDTLVRLIEEFFVFRREMFKGGLRTADISHMRGEKLKEKEGKEHQEKEKEDRENASEPKDADVSARRSRGPSGVNIREELMAMEGRVLAAFDAHNESISGRFGFEKKIAELQKVVSVLNDIEGRVKSNISDAVEVMQESVTQSILDFLRNPIFSAPPGRSSPVDKETDEAETGKGNEPADVAFDAQADLSGGQNSVGTHPINVPVCPNAAVRKVFDDLNSAGDTVAEGRKVSDHDEPVLIPDQDVFDETQGNRSNQSHHEPDLNASSEPAADINEPRDVPDAYKSTPFLEE